MLRSLILLAGAGAILIPGAAAACDCVRLFPESPRIEEDLDRIAAFYPVAAEGIIERDGEYFWRFTPTREFRGPGRKSYPIGLISDCSLAPDEMNAVVGKPVFALLVEGPGDHQGRYELNRCVNFLGPEIGAAIRAGIAAGCKPR